MSSESPVRNGNGLDYELIETLRWEPLCGFLRINRHLARLELSARQLGFPFDETSIRAKLDGLARGDQALRVRLALDPDGSIGVTAQPFTPLSSDTVWRVAIARTRLDKNDPLLHHKTTRRQIYDAARAEFSRDDIDEVILLNNEGRVCEGTITSVFADHGATCCATPALDCGLLPGILREELISGGIVHEAELTEDDLRKAKNILVGNSLRGLIRAKLL
ncbi:aminotransferase class IV family protein [Phyllobacterium leguminum]|uniref:Probable branched-chain-amino-acid aminotransferase n=1 Tax=Phyllobacterium leguminum TaxID=314237 RepID=A0A318T1W4_9HYPH|nr:aminotransferase class IV family protein [Phyllobacterium leguminum]PYE87756.1 4-amino-4-deoxychorismate lyase [Phyllobacterium leguminum]